MKLSESQLRNLVREELSNVLEMHGKPHMRPMQKDPMKDPKSMAVGAGLAGIAITPYAIAQYLQTDPEMMKKVVDMIQSTGNFIQNLEEE